MAAEQDASCSSNGTVNDSVCPRCHTECANKYSVIRHLQAKTLCTATYSQESAQAIINRLRVRHYTADSVRCPTCSKQFKNQKTLAQHARVCEQAARQPAVPDGTVAGLQATVMKLQEEVRMLRTGGGAGTVNITVNNVTNNNNIQLNAFGKENMEYITGQPNYTSFMRACIRDRAEGVCNFLVRKHFHEEHPENHNVCKKVKKDAFINVYDGKQWKPKLAKDALEQLFAGIERQFALFADQVTESGEINKRWLDRFMQEVGIPLEWDFSSEHYEYDHEMPQAQKDAFKKDLFKLALEYICQHSKNRRCNQAQSSTE